MPKVLPISEVKARLPELVTGVEERAFLAGAEGQAILGRHGFAPAPEAGG
jgi:hypothetical protein